MKKLYPAKKLYLAKDAYCEFPATGDAALVYTPTLDEAYEFEDPQKAEVEKARMLDAFPEYNWHIETSPPRPHV